MKLSADELNQYSRHLLLDQVGTNGQLKLKQSKVLVIGAGGLGCSVLQHLSAAGIGVIGIVDDDLVDQSNLHRQVLYKTHDIGKFKVRCAKKALEAINPFITIKIHTARLNTSNAIELFSAYDIIVDGTDNFPTRYLSNDASVLTNKPLVFGSIFKFDGQVSVFNYKNGPTYRCLYPSPPTVGSVPNCSEIGVLGVIAGIIGSLQANEVLKIILDLGNILSGNVLTFNALSMKQSILSFEKNLSMNVKTLDTDYQLFCGMPEIVREIPFQEYKKQSKNFNLLDVRTLKERAEFSINSIHIPINELPRRLHELPQNKNLIVFCESGMRSKRAIQILRANNFKKELINLKDGLRNVTF